MAASPIAARVRGWETRRAAVDERPDGGGHEPCRVATEPPFAIDLLQRPGLAVGPGDLLDDERDAFGLDVHGRRRGGFDRTAEHAFEQLGRFERAEACRSQSPDKAHPLHVGDEIDRLRHRSELVRSDGQEQEDRLIRVAPDDVSEESEGVVIGPLDVIDEQRDRSDLREGGDGDAGQVECSEELGIRREGLESGLVTTGDRLHDPSDRCLCRGPRGRFADRQGCEQAASEKERPADLLVGRDRHAGEPARTREFDRGQQQARLADARLTLEGHGGEAGGRFVEFLRDRLELRTATDDGTGRAAQLDGQRTLRSHEWVERAAIGHPKGRHVLDRPDLAQHVADYARVSSARFPELVRVLCERPRDLGERLHERRRAHVAAADGEGGRIAESLLHQDPGRCPMRE